MKKSAALFTSKNKITSTGQMLFVALCVFSLSAFAQKQTTGDEASITWKVMTKQVQPAPDPLKDMINKLKKSIADSVVSFKDDSNGNVYVSIEGEMLFRPGSAVVDLKGKKALRPLAILLNNSREDFTMMIKGDTETVALKKSSYANSWSLSQTRAASLMSILTEPGREAAQEKATLAKKSAKKKKEVINSTTNPEESVKKSDQVVSKKYVLLLVNSL